MARRKRPYVPKVKGCYECSQRRIDCDRTGPSCNKCSSRGLSCSGFGVKYRFRNGFVPGPRTPRKRSTSSNSYASTTSQDSPASTSCSSDADYFGHHGSGAFRLAAGEEGTSCCGGGVGVMDQGTQGIRGSTSTNGSSDLLREVDLGQGDESIDVYFAHSGAVPESSPECEGRGVFNVLVDYASRVGNDEGETQTLRSEDSDPDCHGRIRCFNESPPSPRVNWYGQISLRRQVSLISPSKQLLLKHFSDRIAPEMVVIDGEYNQWRHLVLPIALGDDLVMSAVLAASAFHLSGNAAPDRILVADPGKLYGQAIQKLQQRRELNGCDAHERQMVILAIVVLLVAVMINGCSDFPVMFRMLQSALDAIGGEAGLLEGGEVAEFSLRQIRKMRVYAAPLLSQDDGLHAITSQASESFDCLYYYRRLYPQYSLIFDTLADLRQQAFNIYLVRVLTPEGAQDESSSAGITNFISTLGYFPPGSLGEHALIWSCFIAASESREPEHKLFFQQFLSRQYIRNGFANILIALDLLQKIWARSSNVDWPALLPEPRVFIM